MKDKNKNIFRSIFSVILNQTYCELEHKTMNLIKIYGMKKKKIINLMKNLNSQVSVIKKKKEKKLELISKCNSCSRNCSSHRVFKIYYDFLASLDVTRTYYMVGKKIIESSKTINHLGVCDVLCGSNPKTLVALKTSLVN